MGYIAYHDFLLPRITVHKIATKTSDRKVYLTAFLNDSTDAITSWLTVMQCPLVGIVQTLRKSFIYSPANYGPNYHFLDLELDITYMTIIHIVAKCRATFKKHKIDKMKSKL